MKEFFKNQRTLQFSEWLLIEAFEPVQTPYGTDPMYFSNKHIVETSEDMSEYKGYFTCIKLKESWILCYIKQLDNFFEIGFMVSKDIINTEDEIPYARFYDSTEGGQSNALSVFNKVFFVMLKLIEKSGAKKIFFEGSNKQLSKLYSGMTQNNNLQKHLNDMGYNFYEKDNKVYLEKQSL